MRIHRARSRLSALFVLALAAACTDHNPATAPDLTQPELPPSTVAAMTCTVAVRAGTLACDAPGAGPGASAAVLGGQGSNVRLAASGNSYDGADTFRINVTLQNLTAQALGTSDGTTPAASGVRVFFFDGPTATGGNGPVAVANEDGEDLFTAAGQKYFQYDGILAPGDTSAPKEWRFTLPNTVTSFAFKVYVYAPVRAEGGWIGMSPIAAAVAVGDTQRVVATVRTLTGGAAGGTVEWSTSNPAVATVNGQGVVTGVAEGTATLTAASNGRTGSVEVRVHAPVYDPPPTFLNFRVDGASVTAGVPVDTLRFRLEFRHTGGYSPYLRVTLRHSSGLVRECTSHTGLGWLGENREYRCVSGFGDGSLGGAWRIERIEFSGRTISHAALLAAGAPAYVHVHSANPDLDAPTLDSLALATDTVDALMGAGLSMDVWAVDRVFAARAEAFFGGTGNPRLVLQGSGITPQNGRRQFHFGQQIPVYYRPGTMVLDSLRLIDSNGNRRAFPRAELAARGFKTQFELVNTLADTVGPAFSAFSFTPDSVAGNGADTVTVTLAAEETVDESGVRVLEMVFERASDPTQRRRCLMNASTREWYREMICPLTFSAAEADTWRVQYIRAVDFMNNVTIAYTAELQALGVPTELVVTAP